MLKETEISNPIYADPSSNSDGDEQFQDKTQLIMNKTIRTQQILNPESKSAVKSAFKPDALDVISRMKSVMSPKKTDTALAEYLEIPRMTLASWKHRKVIDWYLVITKFANKINIHWLMTGKGPMHISTHKTGSEELTHTRIKLIDALEEINQLRKELDLCKKRTK